MERKTETISLPQLLTASELAELLKVKVSTIYVMKNQGRLPYVKTPGHRTMYPLDEISRMIEEGKNGCRG